MVSSGGGVAVGVGAPTSRADALMSPGVRNLWLDKFRYSPDAADRGQYQYLG